MSKIPPFIDQLDLSSRQKRRYAVSLAIAILERVRSAEDANLDRFPLAFQDSDAFANAESSLDSLIDAIVTLDDCY